MKGELEAANTNDKGVLSAKLKINEPLKESEADALYLIQTNSNEGRQL